MSNNSGQITTSVVRIPIYIKDVIGKDLRTRSFFRRDVERIIGSQGGDVVLDFSEVEFISRSVADEICNLLADYPSLAVRAMEGDVEMMYGVVVSGRNTPREFPVTDIKVYHLRTLQEMSACLCAF